MGRFGGRKFIATGVKQWSFDTWKESVASCREFFVLQHGWLAFKFHSEMDASTILAGSWRWDGAGMLLKRWTPLFDLHIERYDIMSIWVKLPNLPFEYWSLDFFKLVGNTLGTFVEADLSFLETSVCCLVKVLVLIDMRKGLAKDIVIKKGEYVCSNLCFT